MLSIEQIAQLNSNNISVNPDHTKSVVKQLWNNASTHQKQKAVTIGSYKNTKSFGPVKDIGKISVRMAIVLSQVFNVNPFYIIGEETEDNGFNENIMDQFLQRFGFGDFATSNDSYTQVPSIQRSPITNDILKDFASNIIDSVEMTDELMALSEEEAIQLLKALNTKAKLNNFDSVIKLLLIKKILAS
ncbi:hypothetical protein [Clostridium magnum]|uniref:Uncharacterized protein n=1 Tax=Clostridium magnum DSM 2767 TaxID=1121326 RepID=A0A161X3B5_9CLOT|nr:hypothetical protein [Clostridium magnum]KZL93968.1 hypothetical protein CLMAG_10210 [Clostridium magnum DSM 2767]SHH99530.1 hypothetical protein SAMN02745944_02045 [Clostridium magnum DSM 2767]